MSATDCPLCRDPGGEVLLSDADGRVVLCDERDYPGFCRVILHEHVREMSDLSRARRHHVLDLVCAAERAVREVMRPDKVNLASLGNVVPHLHWHVIPRWDGDPCFPAAIWAPARRSGAPVAVPADLGARLREVLRRVVAEGG
jgi:diadenosine tetraphosphate (Ap4A) HIT family hydrolase